MLAYEEFLKQRALADEALVVMTAEYRAAIRSLPAALGPRFIDVGICEHLVIVEVDFLCVVELAEMSGQTFVDIAHCKEVRVMRLLYGLEMRKLGDRSTTENADTQLSFIFLH